MDSESKKAKKIIVVSLVVAVVLFVLYGYGLGFLFNNVASSIEADRHINTQLYQPKMHTEALSDAKSDDTAEIEVNQPPVANPQPVVAPQPQPALEPEKAQEMERIPFTSKPVEPGNPESYVDTYGQCPFYENAGANGCTPPPDIKCNADWSVCEYIGEKYEAL